ncbi:glycosyltransferase [Streptacidiphilus sp. ASG 303]|uniref:glycosyltransferase n=1 Tax=Streptacidiphilus sp. ASG 303 TaxID=2896847 RepID=UPI001E357B1B|nr:glycosyltransferase [Streptacidiphilus sp. ASG 303]MCD0484719.1 glycosyltransferase [Streptacidiphilus sp. ASG 303]
MTSATSGTTRQQPPGPHPAPAAVAGRSAAPAAAPGARGGRRAQSRPGRAAPRVLYLAFFFPPTRASGVYRALATANLLADRGWDVTVATAPREFFSDYLRSYDPSLEARIHPAVAVERPRMGYFRWERDVRRYGRLRANLPSLANAAYGWAQRRVFPEHYATWLPHLLARAVRLHAGRRFDAVLATGNPFASFAAAWALGGALRVPYVLDYRDPWTFNPLTGELSFPPESNAWAWERRVLRGAAEVLHVNEPIRQWYADRYPFAAGRLRVVHNGWEPEILGRPRWSPRPRGRPLRFGYIGTLTDHLPLEVLFDGWRLARRDPALAGAELHLHGHLGFFAHSARPLLDRMPDPAEGLGVVYRGPVAKAEVAAAYAEMDAVVFLAGGSRYVTSGKVFEYMATGKPIVSVHRPDHAAAEVLRGHPLWFGGGRLDAEAVAAAFTAAGRAALELTPDQVDRAREHAERFTREATLAPFEERLRRIAGGR